MDSKQFLDFCRNASEDENSINQLVDQLFSLQLQQNSAVANKELIEYKNTINKAFIILCQKGKNKIVKKLLNMDIPFSNNTFGLAFQIFTKNGNIEMLKKIDKDKYSINDLCISVDIAVMNKKLDVLKYLFTLLPEDIKNKIASAKIEEVNEGDDRDPNIAYFLANFIN